LVGIVTSLSALHDAVTANIVRAAAIIGTAVTALLVSIITLLVAGRDAVAAFFGGAIARSTAVGLRAGPPGFLGAARAAPVAVVGVLVVALLGAGDNSITAICSVTGASLLLVIRALPALFHGTACAAAVTVGPIAIVTLFAGGGVVKGVAARRLGAVCVTIRGALASCITLFVSVQQTIAACIEHTVYAARRTVGVLGVALLVGVLHSVSAPRQLAVGAAGVGLCVGVLLFAGVALLPAVPVVQDAVSAL
jgi:hypothetical protein